MKNIDLTAETVINEVVKPKDEIGEYLIKCKIKSDAL